MSPVVKPDSSIPLVFNDIATIGTKGGEHIAAVDVIKKVSVSILKDLQKIACSVIELNMMNAMENNIADTNRSNFI
jgi:hypothetical protein